jgi:uncharacterized iron-regulated membrane protein
VTSPALVRVHRYVALGLGALVVPMGLTGAALVFREELTAVFTPAVKVSPQPVPAGEYQRILAAARRVEPGARSLDIVPSGRPERAAEVILYRAGPERHLFVDPHDGAVVADSDREFLPFAAFFQLHRRFMLGEPGEYAVGVAGLALAFMAISGLVLWWPRKLKYAFRIRWDGDRLAVSYDLHRCAGAAFALLLILNAVIGISMVFDEASAALVNRVSGRQGAVVPAASSDALASGRPLDEIVAAAERAFPAGGVVSRIAIRGSNAPVVVRKRLPGDNETHGTNRIYVDAASAAVLRVNALAELPPGNAMFEWLYPLHTGTLVGTPYRILLVVAGCVPLLSLVTGLIVWRSKAKQRVRAPKPACVRSPSRAA